MDLLTLLNALNYSLVLLFGLFLSTNIAGGWENTGQKRLIWAMYPLLLLVQGVCWLMLDIRTVRQLYPLMTLLPLVLILVFGLKMGAGVAMVGVSTAYLCCQLPRWVRLVVTAVSGSAVIGELSYTLAIAPIYILLRRCFVRIAYDAMIYSVQNMVLFASLPIFYYFFDYATIIYSDAMYAGFPALVEFFPTASILFYVAFLSAYHFQVQQRTQAELQHSMVEAELKQSAVEIENMRLAETQTAIYRHDMRHHLNVIDGFLSAGNPQQAREYIQNVQTDVETITRKRFCENEIVNLLCASFMGKAERQGMKLKVDAKLPKQLPVSDTELCSLLSNGLENALNAAAQLTPPEKWVELYCGVQLHQLLIEIKNPYAGEVVMRDGLPRSKREGHGYGCRSISAIAEHNQGLCSFQAKNGVFTLRVLLPMGGGKPEKME